MSNTDKSQNSSGKRETAKFQELSEWDKILLDSMDNGCKDLHEIVIREREKRKEQQEK